MKSKSWKPRKSTTSYETVDLPMQKHFPPRTRNARPKTYTRHGAAARAKQQTLTQIAFVSRTPDSDDDLEFDEFGEAFEEALRVEEADKLKNGRKTIPLTKAPSRTRDEASAEEEEEKPRARKRRKTEPTAGASSKLQQGHRTPKSEEVAPRPTKRRKTMLYAGPTLTQIHFVTREPSDEKEIESDHGIEEASEATKSRQTMPRTKEIPNDVVQTPRKRPIISGSKETLAGGVPKARKGRKSKATTEKSEDLQPKARKDRKTKPNPALEPRGTSTKTPNARERRKTMPDVKETVKEVPQAVVEPKSSSSHSLTLTQIEFVSRSTPDDTQADPTYIEEEAAAASSKEKRMSEVQISPNAQAHRSSDEEEDGPGFQTQQIPRSKRRIARKPKKSLTPKGQVDEEDDASDVQIPQIPKNKRRIARKPKKLPSPKKRANFSPVDEDFEDLCDDPPISAQENPTTKPKARSTSILQPKPSRTAKRKRVIIRGATQTEIILKRERERAQRAREQDENRITATPKTPTKRIEVQNSVSPDTPLSTFSLRSIRPPSRSPLKERSTNLLNTPSKKRPNKFSKTVSLHTRNGKINGPSPRLEVQDTYSSGIGGVDDATAEEPNWKEERESEGAVELGNEQHHALVQQQLDSQLTSSATIRVLEQLISPKGPPSTVKPGDISSPTSINQPITPKLPPYEPISTQPVKNEISDSDDDHDLHESFHDNFHDSFPLNSSFNLADYDIPLESGRTALQSQANTVNPSELSQFVSNLPHSSQTQPSLPHGSSEENLVQCPSLPTPHTVRSSQATTADFTQTQIAQLQPPEHIPSSSLSGMDDEEVTWDGRLMTDSQLLPESLMDATVPLPPDWDAGLTQE